MNGKVNIWSVEAIPNNANFVEIANNKSLNTVNMYYWEDECRNRPDTNTVAVMYPKGSKPKCLS